MRLACRDAVMNFWRSNMGSVSNQGIAHLHGTLLSPINPVCT
jgi:hypothetical protein